jgi:glycine cleavage system H protein
LKFSKEHVWIQPEEGDFRVGLSAYAQNELGEIVFIELPEIGAHVGAGEALCAIDSLKSASDLYAPFACSVSKVNNILENTESIRAINDDPTGAGWICVIKADDESDFEYLMDEDEYSRYVGEDNANTD